MKRRILIFGVWMLAIGALMFSPYLVWQVGSRPTLKLRVLDKTVPFDDYKEHASLFWALNFFRYPPPPGHDRWDLANAYVGYYPEIRDADGVALPPPFPETGENPWRLLQHQDLEDTDVLYVADTYGVYELDLRRIPEERAHLTRNQVVFGGMTHEETDVVDAFRNKGGVVIAEFNTFGQPTRQDVVDRWEDILNLDWTGWIGRYIEDFANMNDIPNWIPYLWELQTGEKWRFSGPGVVFVHTSERILILEEGKDVQEVPVLLKTHREDDPLTVGCTPEIPYYYWFDVVIPREHTVEHAEFEMQLYPRGVVQMRAEGIPTRFSAILSHENDAPTYYFAGDFADNAVMFGPYQFAFYDTYRRKFPTYQIYKSNEWFYWEFYLPLLENVLPRIEAYLR
ncbi:MAG: hypothetical protein HUU55_18720 [Myxococcales bacterium]|nr:hypothetical protein [Myxococcales bacterium]